MRRFLGLAVFAAAYAQDPECLPEPIPGNAISVGERTPSCGTAANGATSPHPYDLVNSRRLA
eukprot:5207489-Pleurochrysis_carterae.AAC.3